MRSLLSLPLLSALAFGCGPEDLNGSGGNHIGFSYQRSCFYGCPLEQPLLVGTKEQIVLSGRGDAEGIAVRSSDDDIASFALRRSCGCERPDGAGGRIEIAEDASCEAPRKKHCDNVVEVLARGEGDAELELIDAGGDTLDRASVHVREAVRARFLTLYEDQLGQLPETELALAVDGKLELEVTLYDDHGQKLLAPEAVHWHVTDPDVARVSAWLLGSGAELDAGLTVTVEALSRGATEVSVDVPGLTQSVSLKVSAR